MQEISLTSQDTAMMYQLQLLPRFEKLQAITITANPAQSIDLCRHQVDKSTLLPSKECIKYVSMTWRQPGFCFSSGSCSASRIRLIYLLHLIVSPFYFTCPSQRVSFTHPIHRSTSPLNCTSVLYRPSSPVIFTESHDGLYVVLPRAH